MFKFIEYEPVLTNNAFRTLFKVLVIYRKEVMNLRYRNLSPYEREETKAFV